MILTIPYRATKTARKVRLTQSMTWTLNSVEDW